MLGVRMKQRGVNDNDTGLPPCPPPQLHLVPPRARRTSEPQLPHLELGTIIPAVLQGWSGVTEGGVWRGFAHREGADRL